MGSSPSVVILSIGKESMHHSLGLVVSWSLLSVSVSWLSEAGSLKYACCLQPLLSFFLILSCRHSRSKTDPSDSFLTAALPCGLTRAREAVGLRPHMATPVDILFIGPWTVVFIDGSSRSSGWPMCSWESPWTCWSSCFHLLSAAITGLHHHGLALVSYFWQALSFRAVLALQKN